MLIALNKLLIKNKLLKGTLDTSLLQAIQKKDYKIIFVDLFDTLLHRTKHPNYCLKLWAKHIRRELGLAIETDELFRIRQESLTYLSKKMKCNSLAVDYASLQMEVFHRLVNTGLMQPEITLETFAMYSEMADFSAEAGVQTVNESMRSQLLELSEKGIRIFLVSDINLSKSIIGKILEYHGLLALFEAIYISSSVQKSKYVGDLYPYILTEQNLDSNEVVMVGDNKRSDILNAERYGLGTLHIANKAAKLKNKLQLFGSVGNDFKKPCDTVVKQCRKSNFVFSEYLIHYYFFVERVYAFAKKHQINNLFFLAREGLFLKNIFDDYQELHAFSGATKIKAHYLKISRQASFQISLKPLDQEDFKVLKKRKYALSINQFLDNFNAPGSEREQLKAEIDADMDTGVESFFDSDLFFRLKESPTFITFYEKNRVEQKIAFDAYLSSFNADITTDGMTVVDIGWGGTMQESLYGYFNGKIPVTGLYLGLKEIYNIKFDTQRYGLNFSVYPSTKFGDHILMANGQLYEQLAAAPHGCTVGYRNNANKPTVEFHEEQEKYVYENHVRSIQAYMREEMYTLSAKLKNVDYTAEMAQEYMVRLALRTGFFVSKSKLKFIRQISKGFFQNIGANTVGLNYKSKALPFSKKTILTKLLLHPEKLFRYLVKIQPRLYDKGLYPFTFLVFVFYYYILIHRLFRKQFFSKNLV